MGSSVRLHTRELYARDARRKRQRGSTRGQMQEFAAGKFHGLPHSVASNNRPRFAEAKRG